MNFKLSLTARLSVFCPPLPYFCSSLYMCITFYYLFSIYRLLKLAEWKLWFLFFFLLVQAAPFVTFSYFFLWSLSVVSYRLFWTHPWVISSTLWIFCCSEYDELDSSKENNFVEISYAKNTVLKELIACHSNHGKIKTTLRSHF